MSSFPAYPTDGRWIRSLRRRKLRVDPWLPYGWFNELEPGLDGQVKDTGAILLTNRECPYSCLMCDLWKYTTNESVPHGAIPAQIEFALKELGSSQILKLYNSGSFFDPRAIPVEDYRKVADLCSGVEHVLVESHTAFIGEDCVKFNRMLSGQLQVATGLETVHPEILPLLNKGMSLEEFKIQIAFLKSHDISTRAFILLRPPFLSEAEGLEWACRSIDFAFSCGVDICSVIPVRSGNGALDKLALEGYFQEPAIQSLERVLEYGVSLKKGLVFADLWDLERFSRCDSCFDSRRDRLEKINLSQKVSNAVVCSC